MKPKRPPSTIPMDRLKTRALQSLQPLLTLALDEDIGPGDLTTDVLIDSEAEAEGRLIACAGGVVAGLLFVGPILRRVDARLGFEPEVEDGAGVQTDRLLGRITGPLRPMLTAERTMLNFLQGLSGIATLTRKYIDAVAGTGVVVLDTRKTTPGWRYLEKYAVRAGGGTNHRTGLHDGVIIKDNHLAVRAPNHVGETIAGLVHEARSRISPEIPIQVEVERLDYLEEVLASEPDVVLLDNMTVQTCRDAVALRGRLFDDGGPALEASGGISLDNVRRFAETGVDRISIGALTHSAPILDISLEIQRG
ncbi:MAG TPA: carboxylating nicotinate-nucleotide diphosphorylase [Phycisphaerae bacterium]|nr:carboxylating nicotinate-nucleotide diphosphorylase [Phycisphaerae bacterium]HUS45894.1 carboxylating nicotinate-nucleotide diphosphorylase [Phycisphaerae bacterium]